MIKIKVFYFVFRSGIDNRGVSGLAQIIASIGSKQLKHTPTNFLFVFTKMFPFFLVMGLPHILDMRES